MAGEIDRLVDNGEIRNCDVAVFYRTNTPVARLRGRVPAGRAAVQGGRRRAVLRAARDPRRAGLPAGAVQPGRHGQPAAHPQRAQARHRRPGRGAVASYADRERISFAAALRVAAERTRRDGHAVAAVHRRLRRGCSTALAELVEQRRRDAELLEAITPAPATPPSWRPAKIRRTRRGWRTSPSWSRSPASSRATPPSRTWPSRRRWSADWPTTARRDDAGGARARLAGGVPGAGGAGGRRRLDPGQRRGHGHADDPAHREGPGVPGRVPHRLGGRGVPAPAGDVATRRSWPRSAGWPTSASPAPASGSTCPGR